MLGDNRGNGGDFHLLQNVRRTRKRAQSAAAIGTTIERVGNHLVDGMGRKVGSQVLLMARLPAPLAFQTVFPRKGLSGLTRSLEGGLEEFEEFFLAFASSASNAAIRSSSGAVALITAASIIASTSSRVKTLAMPP
jgi:hypothetical protein